MKQGRGVTHVDAGAVHKTMPAARAVNPAHVAQMGTMLGNHATGNGQILAGSSVPLYRGRGLEAPMQECKSHECGSQGRYK